MPDGCVLQVNHSRYTGGNELGSFRAFARCIKLSAVRRLMVIEAQVKCSFNCGNGSRYIQKRAIGIRSVNLKLQAARMGSNSVMIILCRTEPVSKLLGGKVVAVERINLIVYTLNKLLQLLLRTLRCVCR